MHVGIAGADERACDDILLRESAELGERVPLRGGVRQIQRPIEPNIFRDRRVDQRVEILEADFREHRRARLAVGADVPPGEGIDAVRFPCRSECAGCVQIQRFSRASPFQRWALAKLRSAFAGSSESRRATGKGEIKSGEAVPTAFLLGRRFVNRRSLRL